MIGEIISAIIAILKGLFGATKPEQFEVKHEKDVTAKSDDALLDELRRVHQDRPERESDVPNSGTRKAGEDSKEDQDHDST